MGKRPAPFQLLWLYTTTSLIYPKNNISRLFTFYIRSNSFVADNTYSIFFFASLFDNVADQLSFKYLSEKEFHFLYRLLWKLMATTAN